MAELSAIREGVALEVAETKKAGQGAGASVVESTFAETNADELRERLEATTKEAKSNIEAARSEATNAEGQGQTQQGNTQVQVGQTMMAAASVAASSGMGSFVAMGMFATGTALVATGQGNQQEGGTKIQEAPPMMKEARDLSNQSVTHETRAEMLKSQREAAEANNQGGNGDTNSPQEMGKQKGYYEFDYGNGAASSGEMSPAERRAQKEEAINQGIGITTAIQGGASAEDEAIVANGLNDEAENLNALVSEDPSDTVTDDTELANGLNDDNANDTEIANGLNDDNADDTEIANGLNDDNADDTEIANELIGDNTDDTELPNRLIGDNADDTELANGLIGDTSTTTQLNINPTVLINNPLSIEKEKVG